VQQTQPSAYFTVSSTAVLSYAYKVGDNWYPCREAQTTLSSSQEEKYTAKIYFCERSGNNFTLTPLSDENGTIAGTNRVLVVKSSSGSRYIVGLTTSLGYTSMSITLKNEDGQTITNASDDDVLHFTNTSNETTWNRYRATVTGMNGSYQLCYKYNSSTRYLTAPTGTPSTSSSFKYTMGSTSATLLYNDEHGIYISGVLETGYFGVSNISQGFTTTNYNNDLEAGGTTILYEHTGNTWTPHYGTLEVGHSYAMAVREFVPDGGTNTAYWMVLYPALQRPHSTEAHTYFSNGTITSNNVTSSEWRLHSHQFINMEDIVIPSEAAFTVTQGTNGFGIYWGDNGLNVNNDELALLSVSLEWEYMPDENEPENSRLWSVSSNTVTYYPEYSNADLEANTTATDTTCDIFLVQNGKVQIQADEFVDGQTYVLVFVDNGNHYAAFVNGTDIVPVLYANSLPKNLPSDYHFVAEASGQGFILKHNNQAMGVAVNAKFTLGYNAVWTYNYIDSGS